LNLSKISEYCYVDVLCIDYSKESSNLKVKIPNILFQSLMPIFIKHGLVTSWSIDGPTSFWIPSFDASDCKSGTLNAANTMNFMINTHLNDLMRLLQVLYDNLEKTEKIINIMPMGINITFSYSLTNLGLLRCIEDINRQNIVGSNELVLGMSESLKFILIEVENFHHEKIKHSRLLE